MDTDLKRHLTLVYATVALKGAYIWDGDSGTGSAAWSVTW